VEPKVLLLDEQHGALDAKVRKNAAGCAACDDLNVTSILSPMTRKKPGVADRMVR
jgi:ABC-type sulfate/molybdate transport systems ATPase subunit